MSSSFRERARTRALIRASATASDDDTEPGVLQSLNPDSPQHPAIALSAATSSEAAPHTPAASRPCYQHHIQIPGCHQHPAPSPNTSSPAAFGAHVAINLGVLEVLDAAGAGELIDIDGDSQQHPPDATDVDDDVAAVGVICFGPEVDHRRVLAELKLRQPTGAVAQPLELIAQPLGDQLAAGQLLIPTVVAVLRCRPAVQRTQLTQRCIETIEVSVANDRVYPRRGRARPQPRSCGSTRRRHAHWRSPTSAPARPSRAATPCAARPPTAATRAATPDATPRYRSTWTPHREDRAVGGRHVRKTERLSGGFCSITTPTPTSRRYTRRSTQGTE
jgi:hypothetical protein